MGRTHGELLSAGGKGRRIKERSQRAGEDSETAVQQTLRSNAGTTTVYVTSGKDSSVIRG